MDVPNQIWWEEVAGPHRLLESVSNQLLGGHSVLLITGSAFPWRWEFRGNIETNLYNNDFKMISIDCAEDYPGGDVGEFLVQRVAPTELPAYLRCLDNKIQYFKRSNILANHVIWLKGIPNDQCKLWLKFVSDYRSSSATEGLFVIEAETAPRDFHLSGYITILEYYNFVSQTDLQLFCSMIASKNRVPDGFQAYTASLVANLCVTDGEVACGLMQNVNFQESDPISSLKNYYYDMFAGVPRGLNSSKQPHHPFYFIQSGEITQLVKRVWKAQLQVAFPKIELERVEIISKNEDAIQKALCMEYWDPKSNKTGFVEQFHIAIQDPYDLELGTLVYMLQLKKSQDRSEAFLQIPNRSDRNRLHFLHLVRNKLAHIYNNQNCSPQEMVELLQDHPTKAAARAMMGRPLYIPKDSVNILRIH